MGNASYLEKTADERSWFSRVGREPTAPKPQRASEFDRTRLATMSNHELLDTTTKDPRLARDIVRARPSEAGELIQLALQTGRPDVAETLVASMRRDFLNAWGTGEQTELVYRSVLRLQGPHAAEVRAQMRAILAENTQRWNDGLPFDGRPKGSRGDLEGRDDLLAEVDRDPAWGKVYADYFDRPESAAAQLFAEARTNQTALRAHAARLGPLLSGSSENAKRFVHAVMQLQGTSSIDVKRWVVQQLDNEVGIDLHRMSEGIQDFDRGGPQARAERLVPLLAELASQPDIAEGLVRLDSSGAHDVPANMPHLQKVLQDVLSAEWSEPVRASVRSSIGNGAAKMFEASLGTDDHERRQYLSRDAAIFIADAARADVAVGHEESFAHGVGDMLRAISKFLPGPAKKGADLGGALLGHEGPVTSQWNRAALEQLMRRVYEQARPRPDGPDDAPEVKQYDEDYSAWRDDAATQFAILTGSKS